MFLILSKNAGFAVDFIMNMIMHNIRIFKIYTLNTKQKGSNLSHFTVIFLSMSHIRYL